MDQAHSLSTYFSEEVSYDNCRAIKLDVKDVARLQANEVRELLHAKGRRDKVATGGQ